METPNLDYIKHVSGGDIAFENSMLEILKVEFPIELENLKKNFNERNFDEVSLYIHKIKHKIAMFGMNKCFEIASKFEIDIKKGQTEQYDFLLKNLERIHVYLKCK